MERPYSSEMELVGGVGVVAVSGETDLYTAARFRRDIDEAAALTSGDVILDFSDLDLIDSTSLCVMLGAWQRLADEGRSLILVVTRRHVMRVLTITGLHTTFRIAASRREALEQVVAPAGPLRAA
jgi:anti-sigma B factor antagonist